MLKKWCSKTWLYVTYFIGFIMLLVLILNWNEWAFNQKLLITSSIILPLHVLEEWQIPAGFHYQYNLVQNSAHPDRYPMNRLTDMITNFAGELFFICLILYGANTGIIVSITVFCALEVIIHTLFGFKMYKRFREKGKRTIYGPGSVTAYAGFGVLGGFSFYYLLHHGITGADWITGIIVLAIMLLGMIVIPEQLLKSKKSDFAFSSAGYFHKFLDK